MKSAIISLLALAGYATAQGAAGLPTCATDCATTFLQQGVGNCGQGDFKCFCSNSGFISGIACCIQGKCSQSDIDQTISVAVALCASNGVAVPTSITGVCATPTPTGTPAPTSPAGGSSGGNASTTGPASASNTSTTTTPGTGEAPQVGATVGMVVLAGLAAVVALL